MMKKTFCSGGIYHYGAGGFENAYIEDIGKLNTSI
jgi:hypothetical protein